MAQADGTFDSFWDWSAAPSVRRADEHDDEHADEYALHGKVAPHEGSRSADSILTPFTHELALEDAFECACGPEPSFGELTELPA